MGILHNNPVSAGACEFQRNTDVVFIRAGRQVLAVQKQLAIQEHAVGDSIFAGIARPQMHSEPILAGSRWSEGSRPANSEGSSSNSGAGACLGKIEVGRLVRPDQYG